MKRIQKLNQYFFSKFGSGFCTVLSIMSFLFVCSGLVTGLLGHGWFAAWFLVILGLILGILPIADLYDKNFVTVDEPEEDEVTDAPKPTSPRIELDEATKKAIELEAAIIRKRILEKEEERKRQIQEAEEEKEREQARQAALEYAQEQRKLREARRREMEKREKQARSEKNFNQNYFRQERFNNIIQQTPQKACVSSEFFRGVNNASELKKRYLDLMKIYHPDNEAGDAVITQKLQQEYQYLSHFFDSYEKHITNQTP